MFVNVLTNAETNRQKLYRKDNIITILYNGKTSISIRYINEYGKARSHSYNYPSVDFAKEQYENIMAQLR